MRPGRSPRRANVVSPANRDPPAGSGRHRAGGWAEALADPVVGAALDAIHAEPAAARTVESLGRLGGASRAVFAARFTRLTGQPPMQYVTWWRMTCAARLLDDGDPDLTLAQVARQVGYRSEHAFGKAFKRHHGITPGRYRHQRALRTSTNT